MQNFEVPDGCLTATVGSSQTSCKLIRFAQENSFSLIKTNNDTNVNTYIGAQTSCKNFLTDFEVWAPYLHMTYGEHF